MEIGNLMLLGGNFFRAGGAEKLELFQTLCLIPLPKSPFLAPFWRSKHLFSAPTARFPLLPLQILMALRNRRKPLWGGGFDTEPQNHTKS